MTKEKQIEEMAWELENHTCMSQFQAEIASKMLYTLGYRKQSEGEWIKKDGFQVCSNCDTTKPIAFSTVLKTNYYNCDYCPKCGAKMKGGVKE